MRKYKFTDERKAISINGEPVVLRRIRATADFGLVKQGELGGWIESPANLSRKGNAWVCDDAMVFGNASVFEDALVGFHAKVFGNARIFENAVVHGNACAYGNTKVQGHAVVHGMSHVYGDTNVGGNALVYGNASVSGNANIFDNARVGGDASVYGSAAIRGNSTVCEGADVSGSQHVLTLGPFGSRNAFATFYHAKGGDVMVSYYDFVGTLERFLSRYLMADGEDGFRAAYGAAAVIANAQIGNVG